MSKGLEALETIKNAPTIYVGCASNIYTRHPFECKKIEKELKALEIIKELHIFRFYEDNQFTTTGKGFKTNKEIYDLLKEVLL